MQFVLIVVLCLLLVGALFSFAYMMDKWHGCALMVVLAVWVMAMQPVSAATVRTVTDINGMRYYDVMTTNPNESYNGVQGRDPRMDQLAAWLNVKCRGGSGDDPNTQEFCALRDKLSKH